jgi:hypothetical protein
MSEKLLDFPDIDRLHLHTIPFAFQQERLLPDRVSIHPKLHDPEVRNVFIVYPHRLGRIRMNFKDSISFNLNKASACWKNFLLVKISLGQRNVTIVEGYFFFPRGENSGKLGIMLRIDNLDLDHLHLFSTPELLLSGPLAACRPPASLKRVEEIEKITLLAPCMESRPERIFQSTKPPILFLDPQDHRGFQRIKIEEPSSELHGFTPSEAPLLATGMKAIPFSENTGFNAPCEPSR